MARSAEKAMTALARWRAAYIDTGKVVEKRPRNSQECDNVGKAETFRGQIIKEIARKVAQIQNAGLGEYKIRDLNDEINKLLKEKRAWEHRILELGGRDHTKYAPKMLDRQGKEVPGNRGYKYFGAAKDLPGVKELFEQAPANSQKKTRGELMKFVDTEYYGYRDEEDGILLPLEADAEEILMKQLAAEWKERQIIEKGLTEFYETEGNVDDAIPCEDDSTLDPVQKDLIIRRKKFLSHVPVPSQQEVEAALIQRKKQELIDQYCSKELVEQEAETREVMGLDTD